MKLPALVPADTTLDAPALARAVLKAPTVDATALADFLGAPASELAASAVSLRVAARAANEGHVFVHHEHRLAPVMPPEALPEIDVGLEDPDATPDIWREGELVVPKYFSAFLEAPLATFVPGYRAKWRPHELLHRLAGFTWSPDLTRFEAYLSARISELLPVVHWYGFDQIGRASCPEHRGEQSGRELCWACERKTTADADDLDPAVAEQAAAHGLEHLQTELAACKAELESGRRHATPRPGLDASSDAVGYLRAHWNRLTAWSFGAWMERFAPSNGFTDCAAQLRHVTKLADRLLREDVELAPQTDREHARAERFTADLGYRVLLHLEALDSDEAEDALMPAVDALAEAAPAEVDACANALAERLRKLDPAAADRTLAGGWTWRPVARGAETSVCAGLVSALPCALDSAEAAEISGWAKDFLQADKGDPRDLGTRFAEHRDAPHNAAAQFEAWLRAAPGVDLEAERFSGLPETSGEPGRYRLSDTFRQGEFSAAAIKAVLGADDEESPLPDDGAATIELAAIRWEGEPRVVDLNEDVRAVLADVAAGKAPSGETADALLERGFVVWFPPVR